MAVLTAEQNLSGAMLGLTSGLSDLLVLDLGGRRVLYALSRTENSVIELEVAGDGSVSVVGSVALTGTFEAGSEPLLGDVTDAGGGVDVAFAGLAEADGQSVTLTANGTLGLQQSLSGLGTLIAPIGLDLSSTAALVSGQSAGGLNLFIDSGSGFSWQAGLADTSVSYLADIAASVSFDSGGASFVASVSATEDGLNIATATATTLTQTSVFGAADGLPVNTPSDLEVMQRLGETLLVVSSSVSSSLSVVTVDASGQAILSDHILDAEWTYFQGAEVVSTATYGDYAFAAAGGAEGGVSLFTILPGGRLVHLSGLADDASTSLYRVSSLEMTVSGNSLQIYGSSLWEAGLTRLSYDLSDLGVVTLANGSGAEIVGTTAADQLIGSDVGETLTGGSGDDILFDGAGVDVLTGGAGADLYVFHPDGLTDEVTDFERGLDKLDLSGFDFLYDISQLTIAPTADGAILTHGVETVIIHTSDNLPLTSGELTNADILNVDRPPLLAVGQQLVGGSGSDTLNGGAGPDTILGAGGDDELSGSYGDDSILGGADLDLLDGGAGEDTLRGQSEDDTIIGGAGDDLLFGDGGDDVIYGDDFI